MRIIKIVLVFVPDNTRYEYLFLTSMHEESLNLAFIEWLAELSSEATEQPLDLEDFCKFVKKTCLANCEYLPPVDLTK